MLSLCDNQLQSWIDFSQPLWSLCFPSAEKIPQVAETAVVPPSLIHEDKAHHRLFDFWQLPKEKANINSEQDATFWKSKYIIHYTENYGNIAMVYDLPNATFQYYCDSSSCPYTALNDVAAEFVKKYQCRDFFLDLAWVDEHIIQKEKQPVVVPSISQLIQINKGGSKRRNNVEVVKSVNHFSNKGRFSEFNPLSCGKTTNSETRKYYDNEPIISTHSFKILEPLDLTLQSSNNYSLQSLLGISSNAEEKEFTYEDYKNMLELQSSARPSSTFDVRDCSFEKDEFSHSDSLDILDNEPLILNL